MSYVDDAFTKCKSTLEITTTEQDFAASKHSDIREVVRGAWQLDDDWRSPTRSARTGSRPTRRPTTSRASRSTAAATSATCRS
jgi:hypothetical protein